MAERTLSEAARHAEVSPATLRRWVADGVVPLDEGRWTPAAVAQARLVARLRRRGHSLAALRAAVESGRLAFGYVEELLPAGGTRSLADAAAATGLEPALVERIWSLAGFPAHGLERMGEDDLGLLRDCAAVLAAGFPLVAFLQMVRVYGQALAQVADAEVRLFHLYVHEPLIRDEVPGLQMAEEMESLAGDLLPLATPIIERIHRRYLRHFLEQDLIGHMESDLEASDGELGRLRVAIAFADLAGYTRLTEEEGEELALGVVESFVEAVEVTLPDDARVIKTIGDGVMIVGSDPRALADWAVGFQMLMTERPRPRIGIHSGETIYRDGDYFGREVNLAARVAARSGGGEVLVTRPIVDAAGPNLEFELIGEVRLKGFSEPTELFVARVAED